MEGQALEQYYNESLEFYGKVRDEKGITITSMTREVVEGLVIYTAVGKMGDRQDTGVGAVSIEGTTGLDKANAFKAAETQAKSRLTVSLSGVRYERQAGPAQPEPTLPELPAVNNAPAAVVPDVRPATIITAPDFIVPAVTEQTLDNLHREATKLSAPTPDPSSLPLTPIVATTAPVAAATTEQAGIFDEEPETLSSTPPPPAPVVPEPVHDAVLAAVNTPTVTGVVMPVAIPKPADQPTRLEYQEFNTRCMKLVRDFLPKAGKDVPNLLLPYLRKVFNTKVLSPETTSKSLWASTLATLEGGTPEAASKILKGGN